MIFARDFSSYFRQMATNEDPELLTFYGDT